MPHVFFKDHSLDLLCGAGSNGSDPNLFACFDGGGDWPDLDWLPSEIVDGRIGAIGEPHNVYPGVAPHDPRIWPYFDLATEYDLRTTIGWLLCRFQGESGAPRDL